MVGLLMGAIFESKRKKKAEVSSGSMLARTAGGNLPRPAHGRIPKTNRDRTAGPHVDSSSKRGRGGEVAFAGDAVDKFRGDRFQPPARSRHQAQRGEPID